MKIGRDLRRMWGRIREVFTPIRTVWVGGDSLAKFRTDLGYGEALFYDLDEERSVLRQFEDDVGADDIVWDIGANAGLYAVFATVQGADVIAFEPAPENATACRQNLQLNGADAEVIQVAVSDFCGTAKLSLRDQTKHTILDSEHAVETLEVPVKTGDKLAKERSPPSVIKIDVEGAELSVLRGLSGVLRENPPRLIYCEIHPNQGDEDVRYLLQEAGYAVSTVHYPRNQPYYRAEYR